MGLQKTSEIQWRLISVEHEWCPQCCDLPFTRWGRGWCSKSAFWWINMGIRLVRKKRSTSRLASPYPRYLGHSCRPPRTSVGRTKKGILILHLFQCFWNAHATPFVSPAVHPILRHLWWFSAGKDCHVTDEDPIEYTHTAVEAGFRHHFPSIALCSGGEISS